MPKYKAEFVYTGIATVEKLVSATNEEEAIKEASSTRPDDIRLSWSGRSEKLQLLKVVLQE